MFERITTFEPIVSEAGQVYRPGVYAADAGERWEGYVVFFPTTGGGNVVSTPQETAQPSYDALVHWASTLGRPYLEGALDRALRASRGVTIPDSLDPVVAESTAAADAIAVHQMAERAALSAAGEELNAEIHEEAAAAARGRAKEFGREAATLEETAARILRDAAGSGSVTAPDMKRKRSRRSTQRKK